MESKNYTVTKEDLEKAYTDLETKTQELNALQQDVNRKREEVIQAQGIYQWLDNHLNDGEE